MEYVKENNIISKINLLREVLEFKLKLNNGIITEEIIKISQDLDKLIVIYYYQKPMQLFCKFKYYGEVIK